MTASVHHGKTLRRLRDPRGMTLTELMIATAIGAMILTGVVVTYIMSLNGLAAMSNYTKIHADGRIAVEYFAKDMRAVTNIYSFANPSNITVIVPAGVSSSGAFTNVATITYSTSGGALYRTDSRIGNADMLATNISQLTFTLYDLAGNTNSVTLPNAKGIEVDIKLQKTLGDLIQSEDFISARYDMRNTAN